MIVEVVLSVIGVLLVDEVVSLVIVGALVIGVLSSTGAPTPHDHPPGEAECEAPRG